MVEPKAQKISKRARFHVLGLLYLMTFVFVLSVSLPLYGNSSFLEQYTSPQMVSILYALGSIVTFFALSFIPLLLKRLGNYAVTLLLSFITTLFLLGLAFIDSFFFVAPFFVFYLALLTLIFFSFDIFLESYSSDKETGRIRGIYLTITSLAILLGPLIAGFIIGESDYWKMYLLAGVFMVVLILLLLSNFRHFKDPSYERIPFWRTLNITRKNTRLSRVFAANLLMRFFYAWMIIYAPLYLHEFIGFSWAEIGSLLAIALLAFVIFELPMGELADKRYGEKEIMAIGFLIASIATMALVFLSEPIFWLWATVLFIGRMGMSLVEITTESYFFKQVDGTDASIIGFFRNNRPIAYLLAPVIATAALFFVEFKFLFLILGLILLLGVRVALRLQDTK